FATVVRVIVVSIRRGLPTIHCRAPTRWVPITLRLHLTLTECAHKGSSLARPTPLRNAPLPITLAPKKLIRTRRASERSASEPSLARRVSMCKDAKLSCRGNKAFSANNLGQMEPVRPGHGDLRELVVTG